ncbi:hypothetical protein [Nostoc sp. UHCC 0870]|uniref:hypothetical protein n=1 Tax=Nostoc sp. UHCC 0870 TaxID=2914041 RepID=UPI001EDD9AD6|nr:hypothetical protein [Nostoc sp. UHCC 0870]UKP00425.1 hypothetical protein L6494_12300 [Nostoc sp. UHCC 0870]
MSVDQNSIQAFIQILKSPANLISPTDWDELLQLWSNLPENDDTEISGILDNWLRNPSRSQLLAAYRQNLRSISPESQMNLGINLGLGGTTSPTKRGESSPSSKELLDNAIKNNAPLSDKQKSQPTP